MSISQRTKEIVNWHLEGHSRARIVEALAAEGVARPGAVIDAALREVAAVAGTGDQDVEWYKAALRMLYGANVEEKNLKDAHHVLKDMMAVDDVIGGAKRRANASAAGAGMQLTEVPPLPPRKRGEPKKKAARPKAKTKAKAKAKPRAKTKAKTVKGVG